jgi:hypothetical protein
MKKLATLFVLFVLTTTALLSQTQYVDVRLSSVYSEEYLSNLQIDNPQKIDYLNWMLDNSYTIVDAVAEKLEYMPYFKYFDLETKTVGENVEVINQEEINILVYSFQREYDMQTYYRIGNSGQAIVFESLKQLAINFKNFQDEN